MEEKNFAFFRSAFRQHIRSMKLWYNKLTSLLFLIYAQSISPVRACQKGGKKQVVFMLFMLKVETSEKSATSIANCLIACLC